MKNLNHSRALATRLFAAALLLAGAGSALAEVHYVDANSTNATPPYTNWTTAATNIQDAVDAAVAGDEIVVTNGVYATGGRAVYGTMTNRVAVDKPLTLRSVNGPQVTSIQGRHDPSPDTGGNGDGGIRCVHLINGVTLSGFCLTNGATRSAGDEAREQSGGGLWCETTNGVVVSNCVVTGNTAYFGGGGGAYQGTLNGCTLSNNSAIYGSNGGGGASQSTLNNCTLSGNSAGYGGGSYQGTLNNCTLTGNSAGGYGGGAFQGTLTRCTLSGNSAYNGGGAYQGTLSNCTLSGNSAISGGSGGGAYQSELNICTLTQNSASTGGGAFGGVQNNCTLSGNSGDGAHSSTLSNCLVTGNSGWGAGGSTLNNCTLSGNSGGGATDSRLNNCALTDNPGDGAYFSMLTNCTLSGNSGVGASSSTLYNCIIYFNQGTNCDSSSALNYCCTTPLPANGVGNISLDPQLASASHLSAASPCRGAGNPAYATGTDIDGESWANPPSIGCDEYNTGAVTGPLNVGIAASFTNLATGFAVQLATSIEGRTLASTWDFGDGLTATNQPLTSHAWAVPGDFAVVLRAYNESQPGGISATVTVHVVNEVHYVAAGNATPVAPYTSWAAAATNIQQAVNVAIAPGAQVVVMNGNYAPIAVLRPLAVRSINGPLFTVINGGGLYQCASLVAGASLSGFTLTSGRGGASGGTLNDCTLSGNSGGYGSGAFRCTLNDCTLTGNSATDGRYYGGGGAYGCTLNHCTLSNNWAAGGGGGAGYSTLNNCVVTGNSAEAGGGAYQSTLNHCTLSGNSAYYGGRGGGASSCKLNDCTLTGNVADYEGGGAYGSLLSNCILSGNSASSRGGGVYESILSNCTLSRNVASQIGGGAFNSTLNNCIVYFNSAPQGANYEHDYYANSSILNYCCTTPLPASGVGNIFLDPQLASASHLSASSPCRGAGNTAFATGTDIDGEPWARPPSIGCDEYDAGAVTGPLSVGVAASFTNVATGFTVEFAALIEGQTSASVWDFADGVTATNQPYPSHAWASPGDYAVVLRAFSESQPGGISATLTVHVGAQPVHYVATVSANPVAPFTSWATAATNIQDAVNAAAVPGALVLVTNGTYSGGVGVSMPLSLRSANGPHSTTIYGGRDNGVRCAYLASGASLSGFTLTNGAAEAGGGVYCQSATAVVSNCVVVGNWAEYGGGAYQGTLKNCILSNNLASGAIFVAQTILGGGGGAANATLDNCTLSGNSSVGYYDHQGYGGGGGGGAAYSCTLNNCALAGNSADFGGGVSGSTLNNCALTGNSLTATAPGYSGGGGAHYSTLNNCALTGNSAYFGGGANWGTLNNCTLAGNSTYYGSGGGAANATLNNCIVYFNAYEGNYAGGTLNYCCTMPQPTNGVGNITNAPLFVDTNGWANLRLQSNSPCLNAGNNSYITSATDLDGDPRIAGGTVDIGAYEFQSPASMISYAWLQQYGLPVNSSTDAADPDGDGLNNRQEWICGTDPTDALSALRLLAPAPVGPGVVMRWESVADRTYFLERSTTAPSGFTPLATGILGQPGTTTYTDTNAIGAEPRFYRVGVSTP